MFTGRFFVTPWIVDKSHSERSATPLPNISAKAIFLCGFKA